MSTITNEEKFIGKGIKFPLELVGGSIKTVTGIDLIKSNIQFVLGWSYGERYFLPEYGSRLFELIEEPNDNVLVNIIEHFVINSLRRWEPRVRIEKINITRPGDAEVLDVAITYLIRNTQIRDSFVYPFYTNILY